MKEKIKAFWKDKDGSEATEMVATTAMLVCFILIAVMILSYLMAYNNVNFATKRVARNVEVTGIADTSNMLAQFNSMLGDNETLIDRRLSLTNVTYTAGNRIQLKDTFRVTTRCNYIIQLINPGSFDGYRLTLPIRCSVTGMSEVYISTK